MSKKAKGAIASLPKVAFQVSGFQGCPFFEGAVSTLTALKKTAHGKTHDIVVTIKKITHDKWPGHLEEQCTLVIPSHKSKAAAHKTSPFIMCNSHFIGGYDQLVTELQKPKPFAGPLRKKRSTGTGINSAT
jgi:hypothetical protein